MATPASAADWLHWRGPEQTGVSRETNLPDHWSDDPADPNNNLVWKAPYGCRSTPLVMGGKVFIITGDSSGITEGEKVVAFDAKTGQVLWEHKFGVWHTDIVSNRLGWANLAGDPETGYVYAHGTQGLLLCLDGKTGKPVWDHSLTEEYGRVSGYGGRIGSPTLDGNLVIMGLVNASWGDQARGQNRFVAFDKKTGNVVWWSSPCTVLKGTYYSNPIVEEVNGQRLLITGAADGEVLALQVHTGKKVWSYPVGANVLNASPVSDGKYVYISNGEENLDVGEQGRVVCVDATHIENGKPKLVWEKIGVKAGLASPLLADGKLFVPDDSAKLWCFDAKTGKQLWRYNYGRVSRAAPVWADGKIYIEDVNGHFHILKPGDRRCEELQVHTFHNKDGDGFVETNGTPAVADGRIYFGTRDELYCIGKKDWNPAKDAGKVPAPPAPKPGSGPAAQLLAYPADVVLAPGGGTQFTLHAFDANGNPLGAAPPSAEWSLPQPPKTPTGAQPPALRGTVANGKLTVAKEVPGQQGVAEAKAGNLKAEARVRVAPQLPYKPDFAKVPVGATPGGWVNVTGKYAVVEKDGKHVLKKLANSASPPLARVNAYIGMPTLHDYTIQADACGDFVHNYLPDMGVVANRYQLQLNGNKQELRLLSWDALPRIDKTIEYKWQPNVWYRFKLSVRVQGDKAQVLGKVWPRDQAEPKDWTVTLDDPRPNKEGSPALYAYIFGVLGDQPGASAYFDNVSVVPNGAAAPASGGR